MDRGHIVERGTHYELLATMRGSFKERKNMKTLFIVSLFIVASLSLWGCGKASSDHAGPEISDVKTSGDILVISDCLSTSVTITAKVTDLSEIANVLFWYRVGSDQEYKSNAMELNDGSYGVLLEGTDLQGNRYGNLEFYISAQDVNGNLSKSAVDDHVQFLPCVNN